MNLNETLLEVERLDQQADALRERRAGLPERAKLETCRGALVTLARERAEADARRAPFELDERRLEGEVAELGRRAQQVEDKLYSGKFTQPKELEDLQTEMQSFQRRQAELEEEELGVMEQIEQLDDELRELDGRRTELEKQAEDLAAAIAKACGEIDAELEGVAAARDEHAARLPGEWLSTYERVRQQPRLRGKATAVFGEGRCGGCRGTLPVMDVSRIRREPPEVVIQCPGCSRLLLR